MKNTHYSIWIVLMVFVLGCGLLGGNKIENAVIDSDLEKQKLNVTEGPSPTWDFSRDQGRCFNIISSNYAGDTAELTLSVASFYESEALAGSIFTVFGKVAMSYKRNGSTWTLVKAESNELIQQILEQDKFEKFLEISAPLCRNYRALLSK